MNMAWIKKVYLYLVSLVSLIILIVASIMLINMALKTWVFPKADTNYYEIVMCTGGTDLSNPNDCPDQQKSVENEQKNRTAQKQRDASTALAMIIVATPVFLYHWKLARKES